MVEVGVIRNAHVNDLEHIITIEQQCFKGDHAYSPQQLKYLLTKANSLTLVETKENNIRGFVIILLHKGTRIAGLETIDVTPLFQKQGIALKLLIAAEEELKQKNINTIRLEVSVTNYQAIHLYEKQGYTKTKILKNYYQYNHDGSKDAFRMIKKLQ
ncbi:MAG: N-acetyltransferase [Euryarchaeota archaeon]|nr:N-acetyltransferase [Euryarchaeota archaeon]